MKTHQTKPHTRLKARSLALALAATFTITATATATASATTPEFKPSTKQAFSGTIAAMHTESSSLTLMACSKGTSAGEVTGASTLGGVVLTLTGCKSEHGTQTCRYKSVGAKEGEIVTKALQGELGEVSTTEAASGVGLLLQPASGKVWSEIEGTCLSPEVEPLEGSLAAEVVTTKKSTKIIDLSFVGATGSQKIKTIVVKGTNVKPRLTFFLGTSLSWSATETLDFTNALEVT